MKYIIIILNLLLTVASVGMAALSINGDGTINVAEALTSVLGLLLLIGCNLMLLLVSDQVTFDGKDKENARDE